MKNRKKSDYGLIANVPPFHPDYVDPSESSSPFLDAPDDSEYDSASSDELRYSGKGTRVRRGSEGYEVLAVDREEILRRYILSRGEEVGHYKRYTPDDPSSSVSGSEDRSEDALQSGRVDSNLKS